MLNSSSLIDWEQLDMIADGFSPDFVEIYQEYLAETPDLFLQLRHNLAANDAVASAKTAHQIKGSSGNFGFIGVSQPMAKLEVESKGGSLAGAQEWLTEAEGAFQQAALEVKAKRGA